MPELTSGIFFSMLLILLTQKETLHFLKATSRSVFSPTEFP